MMSERRFIPRTSIDDIYTYASDAISHDTGIWGIFIAADPGKIANLQFWRLRRQRKIAILSNLAGSGHKPGIILFLNKKMTYEHRSAIIVKGDDYGKEIRNWRRRIE